LSVVLLILSGCDRREGFSLEEALHAKEETILTSTGADETPSQQIEEVEKIVVYVCGHVMVPGVYELEKGSRIVAAVEAAGGFLSDAATEAVNLAEPLKDGMQVNIPSLEEQAVLQKEQKKQEKGLVNINKASVEELCTLPGIGQAKAETIIRYRESVGLFEKSEDIQLVTGIGKSLYLQIKDKIYIE